MTTISSTPQSRSAPWMLWGGLALIVAFFTLAAIAFVTSITGPFNPVGLIGAFALVFLALALFYVVAFGYYRVAADRRLRAAAAAYPGAYLLPVVIRPKITRQFRAAAAAHGLAAGKLPWNNYAVFVADADALRLFAGSFPPSARISLPTTSLASVVAHPVVIGVRTLDCVILAIADASGAMLPIELVPVRWQGALIRSVPAAMLPAELAAMKAATHAGL